MGESFTNRLKMFSVCTAIGLVIAQPAYANQQRVGVVGAANPNVFVKESDKKNPLVLGDDIFFEQTINTSKDGKAQLLFIDKSALTIGPNSSIVIDKFVYDPAKSVGDLTINSVKGTLRFIGGALSKKKAVKIKTPAGTIGIRGGITIVDVDPNTGKTDATFVYGEELSIEGLDGTVVTTSTPGSSIVIPEIGAMPKPPVKVTPTKLVQMMGSMESNEGQTGGAKNLPAETEMKKALPTADAGDDGAGGGGGKPKQAAASGVSESEGDASNNETADGKPEGRGDSQGADKAPLDAAFAEDSGNLPPAKTAAEERQAPEVAKVDVTETQSAAVKIFDGKPVEELRDCVEETSDQDCESLEQKLKEGLVEGVGDGKDTGNEEDKEEEEEVVAGAVDVTEEEGENSTSSGGGVAANALASTTGSFASNPDAGTHEDGRIEVTKVSNAAQGGRDEYLVTFKDNSGVSLFASSDVGEANGAIPVLLSPTAGTAHAYIDLTSAASDSTGAGTVDLDTNAIVLNGFTYDNGGAFVSKHGNINYYYLNNGAGEEFKVLIGNTAQLDVRKAEAGIAFYNFLPDASSYNGGNPEEFGFFEYDTEGGAAAYTPFNLGTAPTYDFDSVGFVVNNDTNSFLTGFLDWDDLSTNGNEEPFVISFGRVNKGGNTPFKGFVYEFDMRTLSNSGEGVEFGKVFTDYERVYGDATYGVEGFSLSGSVTDDQQAFRAAGRTDYIDGARVLEQPLVRDYTQSSGGIEAVSGNHDKFGYTAGFVVTDYKDPAGYAAAEVKPFISANVEDVKISFDAGSGEVDARIFLEDPADPDVHAPTSHQFRSSKGTSAYIGDNVYAVAATDVKYGDVANRNDVSTYSDKVTGVLASADALTQDTNMECASCDYVHWGVWASEAETGYNATDGRFEYDLVHLMPYIAGDPTNDMDAIIAANSWTATTDFGAGANGIARFDGKVIEAAFDSSTGDITHNPSGDYFATVNMAGRQVTEWQATLHDGMKFGTDTDININGTGMAQFQGVDVKSYNGSVYTTNIGTINGAFFGPNAEEMGGNFHVISGGVNRSGVYLGAR